MAERCGIEDEEDRTEDGTLRNTVRRQTRRRDLLTENRERT